MTIRLYKSGVRLQPGYLQGLHRIPLSSSNVMGTGAIASSEPRVVSYDGTHLRNKTQDRLERQGNKATAILKRIPVNHLSR